MFYQNISRYALATHLALAAALPAALTQFVSCDTVAKTMLWTSLFAWIWMFAEPSVRRGETVSRAVSRVANAIIRDPLAWLGGFAVLFAFSRWLNSNVALVYDAEKTVWSVCAPGAEFLPASSGNAAFFPLALAVTIVTVVLGVRHAIGKNARVWFGVCSASVSATGAIAAVICAGYGPEEFKNAALMSFGAENFIGAMYALFLPMAMACGIEAEERNMSGSRLFFAWAVAGNAAGAFMFLPGILGVAYLLLSVAVAVISFAVIKRRAGAAATARAASMLLFGVVLAAISVVLPPYAEIQKSKIAGLDPEVAFTDDLSDRNAALNRISQAMWMEHPWSGVGLGEVKLNTPFFADKEEWTVLPPEPSIGSNAYFTLIAERGIAGALLCVVFVGFLLWNWVYGLLGSFSKMNESDEGYPWFYTVSPSVWVGPLVLLATAADAWFSNGLISTALALCAASAMALSAASFPGVKRKKTIKD
jgi:hypothetical protein